MSYSYSRTGIKPRAGQPIGIGPCDHCGLSMKTPVVALPQYDSQGIFIKNKLVHKHCAPKVKRAYP